MELIDLLSPDLRNKYPLRLSKKWQEAIRGITFKTDTYEMYAGVEGKAKNHGYLILFYVRKKGIKEPIFFHFISTTAIIKECRRRREKLPIVIKQALMDWATEVHNRVADWGGTESGKLDIATSLLKVL